MCGHRQVAVRHGFGHVHGRGVPILGVYMRWHNAQAGPKTNFAPDSPIRTWTENRAS